MDSASSPATIDASPRSRFDAVARNLGLCLTTLVGILMLGRLLYWCRAGLDFSDESFYLTSVSHPELLKIWVMQFAQVYRPLWLAVGENVVLYRQANILIFQILAFILCWLLIRRGWSDAGRWTRAAIAFGAASAVNAWLCLYLPTPNYNGLALQALLVAASGIVLANPGDTRENTFGWLLIGLGGALAFLAKPTTAAVLAVFIALYALASGKVTISTLIRAAGTAVAALLLFGWVVHGSPNRFAHNLYEGYRDIQAMGGHSESLFRLGLPRMGATDRTICLAILACSAISATVSAYRSQFLLNLDQRPWTRWAARTIWLALVGACGFLALGTYFGSTRWPAQWRPTGLGSVMLFAGLIAGTVATRHPFGLPGKRREGWCLAGLFAILPYAYAFGTNNNYCLIMMNAGVFWSYAGIGLLAHFAPGIGGQCAAIFLVAAGQVFLISGINHGIANPYKQFALPTMRDRVELGEGRAAVLVSAKTAQIVREIRAAADGAGFKPGMDLLDLTGQEPASAFVLDAKPVGNAWMVGARPGSAALTQRCLDRADPEVLRRAWIMANPGDYFSIPVKVLERYGLSLEEDYELVGKAPVVKFSLYRPKRPPAVDEP